MGAWFLVISGMATLLIAANGKKRTYICQEVVVNIRGVGEKLYISKADILQQLKKAAKNNIVGVALRQLNVGRLEKTLEDHLWIRDAELYFDNRDVLHVSVYEREPIARVFTTTGKSFYIDSTGHRMPLLEAVTVRVPVVTNFSAAKRLYAADSLLLRDLTFLARFITGNGFWNAQIAQIDITPERDFELLPVIGNHVIQVGTVENLEEKMHRLFLFYREVLGKTGFDRYAVVDVRYKDQVIGRKTPVSQVDSVQLQKNIAELMERTRMQLVADSIAAAQ